MRDSTYSPRRCRVYLGMLLGCGLLLMLGSCASILPKDWPIKGMTLPRGCRVATKPAMMANMDSAMPDVFGDQKWDVCFNYDKGWDALVAHLDKNMAGLGYQSSDLVGGMQKYLEGGDKNPAPWKDALPDMSNFSRMYNKEGSGYLIMLQNMSMFKGMEGKAETDVASFCLSVVKIGAGMPLPLKNV